MSAEFHIMEATVILETFRWIGSRGSLIRVSPRCLPQRNESIGPYKDFCIDVQSRFICNSPSLETSRTPTNRGVDKL